MNQSVQFLPVMKLINRSRKRDFLHECKRAHDKLNEIEVEFVEYLNYDGPTIDYVPVYHELNDRYIKLCKLINERCKWCISIDKYFSDAYQPLETPIRDYLLISKFRRFINIE